MFSYIFIIYLKEKFCHIDIFWQLTLKSDLKYGTTIVKAYKGGLCHIIKKFMVFKL